MPARTVIRHQPQSPTAEEMAVKKRLVVAVVLALLVYYMRHRQHQNRADNVVLQTVLSVSVLVVLHQHHQLMSIADGQLTAIGYVSLFAETDGGMFELLTEPAAVISNTLWLYAGCLACLE